MRELGRGAGGEGRQGAEAGPGQGASSLAAPEPGDLGWLLAFPSLNSPVCWVRLLQLL